MNYEQAKANYERTKADYEAAVNAWEDSRLYAPFDGLCAAGAYRALPGCETVGSGGDVLSTFHASR